MLAKATGPLEEGAFWRVLPAQVARSRGSVKGIAVVMLSI